MSLLLTNRPRGAPHGPRLIASAATALLAGALSVSAAPAHTHVSFRTADNVTLRGQLWVGGPTAVVFSHMYGTDQSSWFELAGRLAAAGHTVLTYDFRGVGRSSGRLAIRHTHRDVLAAAQFVRSRRARKVVLVGASMGGTASIVAAGQTKVDGLVVLASGNKFQGLDAVPVLPRLRVPKLFVVGRGDAPFHDSVREMHARSPQPKRLLVLPTTAHGTYMFRTQYRGAIYDAIVEFVRESSESTR